MNTEIITFVNVDYRLSCLSYTKVQDDNFLKKKSFLKNIKKIENKFDSYLDTDSSYHKAATKMKTILYHLFNDLNSIPIGEFQNIIRNNLKDIFTKLSENENYTECIKFNISSFIKDVENKLVIKVVCSDNCCSDDFVLEEKSPDYILFNKFIEDIKDLKMPKTSIVDDIKSILLFRYAYILNEIISNFEITKFFDKLQNKKSFNLSLSNGEKDIENVFDYTVKNESEENKAPQTSLKEGYILFENKTIDDYKTAIEDIFFTVYNYDIYEVPEADKNPIVFCNLKNGEYIPVDNYTLTDFIIEAEQIEQLRNEVIELINFISSANIISDCNYMFCEQIGIFAELKKEYINYFLKYLNAIDIKFESNEGKYIDRIIEKYGFIPETIKLITGRLTTYAGKNGENQVLNYLKNELGIWLKDQNNFDLFYYMFVKQLGFNYQSEEQTLEIIKPIFDIICQNKSEKPDYYINLAKADSEKFKNEKNEFIENINNERKTRKEKENLVFDEYDNIATEFFDKKLIDEISFIYYLIADDYVDIIFKDFDKLNWTRKIIDRINSGFIYLNKSTKIDFYSGLRRAKNTIGKLYDYKARLLVKTVNENPNNSEIYKDVFSSFKTSLKYDVFNSSSWISYLNDIVLYFYKIDKNLNDEIFQNEVAFFKSKAFYFDIHNENYCSVYYNLSCLYSILNEKEKSFKFLEKMLRLNLETKSFTQKNIIDENDFSNIKSETKFQELMEKYFPSKKKAKPEKEISETKTVNKEAKIDLSGKKVCLTGKAPISREEVAKILTEKGAIVQDSVNKTTEILICGEEDTESSKAKKARENGVMILTYNKVIDFRK